MQFDDAGPQISDSELYPRQDHADDYRSMQDPVREYKKTMESPRWDAGQGGCVDMAFLLRIHGVSRIRLTRAGR
jgi:hypothetical protein